MATKNSTTYDPGKPQPAKQIGPNTWIVDSFRGQSAAYQITITERGCSCTCPHYQQRLAGTDAQCKHISSVIQQSAWAKAAERAQALTDEQLDRWLRIHTETGNLVVAGAIRWERARRKQAAARQAHIHSIIDQDSPAPARPAYGAWTKVSGPTSDREAAAAIATS